MSNGEDLRPPDTNKGEAPASPESGRSQSNTAGNFVDQAIKVITNPVGFYQSMPKSGGFTEPLIFMVVLAVASGVISAVLSMVGLGVRGAMIGGLAAIILVPIMVVIFGFVGAAIVYVIWKLMGSAENYETAYRCVAYSSAIGPVVTVLGIVPYVGTILSAIWPMALMAFASIHVHRRSEKASWGVFGALALFFVFINLSAERAADDMAGELENLQRMMEEQSQ